MKIARPIKERFDEKIAVSTTRFYNETPCWEWQGWLNDEGYAYFNLTRKKKVRAHKLAWELYVGENLSGSELDHTCRNRKCVNPDHLELVSHKENMLRGNTVNAINAAKTHCIRGHPFDEANTRIRSNGWRACRKCEKLRRQ